MRFLFPTCCLLLTTACVYNPQTHNNNDLNDENTPNNADTTIRRYQEGDKTIEEQRVKGFLYSVKVIPKEGKPYYLINADGDNATLKNVGPQQKIPSWTLFNW